MSIDREELHGLNLEAVLTFRSQAYEEEPLGNFVLSRSPWKP